MKTIFSYLAKCLLTYTLSFALLQVQIFLPIENLRYVSGNVMAAGDNVTADEDGVATKSGSLTLENDKSNLLIDHLSMIAFGFFTSRALTICKPLPIDVMVAAAGGVAYIGGELYSFNAFKDLKSKDKISYSSKENGENDTQIEMLMAQKKGYDDIAKTAKTKAMIQSAAMAAYGIAAGYALSKSLTWEMASVACGSACPASAEGFISLSVADKDIATASAVNSKNVLAACTSAEAGVLTSLAAPLTASTCSSAGKSCSVSSAYCASEVSVCVPSDAAVFGADTSSPDAFQKFASEGLKLPGIDSAMNDKFISDTINETYISDYQEKFQISSFIDKSNPFYELNKKMEFDETNFETQINSYARNRDRSRFYQGEISSTTIDSYSELKSSLYHLEIDSESGSFGEALKIAFVNGIDLLVPSANASGISTMLAGAAGIFLALNKATAVWVDKFMSTPSKRALIWGAGAVLALVAMNSSKKIQESAEKNSGKIQEIINKLNTMGQQSISSVSGYQIGIPSKIPFSSTGNASLSLGTESAPCADTTGTTGCGSLQSGIETNTSFASLGGSFGVLAGTAGAAADGITGSNSIPSSAVDGLVELSNNNNAIKKKLDAVQRKFNQSLEEKGEAPLNFDKVNKNILAKLRKNTQAVLGSAGKSASDVLAAIGPVSKEETPTKKVASAAPSNNKLKMTSGVSKAASSGFRLDLENEGSNDGLMNDEVLANQAAANALNGEAQDDIVANKDVSIFKVISVRYLKSGFNKLLEEDK